MDQQLKKKVLLAVLGVAVLGAGSYYFLAGSSSSSRRQVGREGPVQRKTRKNPRVVESRQKKRRGKARVKVPTGLRKERVAKKSTATSKKTRRHKAKTLKKKKIAPAA